MLWKLCAEQKFSNQLDLDMHGETHISAEDYIRHTVPLEYECAVTHSSNVIHICTSLVIESEIG